MDKASVLGDAIKYLEYLQQRVSTLEESQVTNESTESVMVVEKSQNIVEDEGSDNGNSDELRLPEVEARVLGENILLKIQCEKRKGLLRKILGEVEKLGLGVVDIGVAPFGSLALDITITAEMEHEFRLPMKDVVTALRSALQAAAAEET